MCIEHVYCLLYGLGLGVMRYKQRAGGAGGANQRDTQPSKDEQRRRVFDPAEASYLTRHGMT